MAKKRVLRPQSVWDAKALEAAFAEAGVKSSHVHILYRYCTLYAPLPPPPPLAPRPPSQACRAKRRYLLKHPDADWVDVPELPKAAVELLTRDFVRCTSRVVQCQSSADGETSKLLLELQDGLQVEAVIMRYDTTGASAAERRGTSCAAVLMYGWWHVHKSSL